MKFLIDAQLPPALASWITARGHSADHVAALGMLAASDRAIVDLAEHGDYVLLSKDGDFILLRFPDRFALVWLRIGNATNRALSAWLGKRWPEIERLLNSGERFVEVR